MQISATLRSTLADAIDAAVNNGTGTSTARVQNTAQTATYATLNLSDPAFGNAATGVITLQGTPTDTSASAGTGTRLGWYDGAATPALVMTMSLNDTGSPDLDIPNNTFAGGEQIQITSLTVTVPAGTLP